MVGSLEPRLAVTPQRLRCVFRRPWRGGRPCAHRTFGFHTELSVNGDCSGYRASCAYTVRLCSGVSEMRVVASSMGVFSHADTRASSGSSRVFRDVSRPRMLFGFKRRLVHAVPQKACAAPSSAGALLHIGSHQARLAIALQSRVAASIQKSGFMRMCMCDSHA